MEHKSSKKMIKYESLRVSDDGVESPSDSPFKSSALTENSIPRSDSMDALTSEECESKEYGEVRQKKELSFTDEMTLNLSDDSSNDVDEDSDENEENELFGLTEHSTLLEQLTVLVKQALPVVISFFLGIGGTFINLVFAGNYVHETGDKSTVFAGVSLANVRNKTHPYYSLL